MRFLVPGNCLDIGCGNGRYGEPILRKVRSILQIDLVDRRSEEALHYPFQAMDAMNLDLDAKSFDNVVAFDVMEHLEDDRVFLQSIRKVCRKRLILSVPNSDDAQPRRIGLTHMHHTDKTHKREYSRTSLAEVLERNGFSVLEIQAHTNRGLLNASWALAKGSVLSRIAAKSIYLQNVIYERLELFENSCISDWFCAADVV